MRSSCSIRLRRVEDKVPPIKARLTAVRDNHAVHPAIFWHVGEAVTGRTAVDANDRLRDVYLHKADCITGFARAGDTETQSQRGSRFIFMDAADPGIPGDSKDWTWVLEKPCNECGFVAADLDLTTMSQRIRDNAQSWADVLDRDDESLRVRPRADKWSTLEYAFHVRDVFELYDFRLGLMLDQDGPRYPNWDQDVTAVEKNYGASDPGMVKAELVDWAERLASRFDAVTGDQWQRTGFRSDGAAFTVDSFARYLLHDPVHHLWDVGLESS